jgi:GcrA cell cycle regulator
MSFVWDDATNARLGELHRLGHSASEIGRLMGTTKNSIIGKVRRLGLSSCDNARLKLNKAMPKPVVVPARPMPVEASKPVLARKSALVSFGDLEPHHCKFPIGDPREDAFGFCGQQRVPGRPYCECCTQRSVQPREPRVSRKSHPIPASPKRISPHETP